jgi:hypothetical protein
MRVFNKKALRAFALVLILFFICTLDVNVLAAKPDRKAPLFHLNGIHRWITLG